MNRRIIRGITTLFAIILTAKLGTIQNENSNIKETWYDLPMHNIVERADAYYGLEGVYEVREDGVKTYNGLVIVATNWDVYPYGSIVETSLGTGVVLDMQTSKDKTVVDIATSWGKGSK